MAGYNTTAEILSLGARALLVPRRGPSAEQQMRASRFAQRGWVDWLPPASLSSTSLANAVLDALDKPVGCAGPPPDLLGRQRAALHLLNGSAPARWTTRCCPRPGPTTWLGVPSQLLGEA